MPSLGEAGRSIWECPVGTYPGAWEPYAGTNATSGIIDVARGTCAPRGGCSTTLVITSAWSAGYDNRQPQQKHESRLILLPNRQAINARWSSLALARGWGQLPARRLFSLEVTLQAGGPRCRPRRRALVEGRKRKEDLSMVSCVRNVMSE